MRKSFGVVLAAAALLSTVAIGAGPAGSATTGLTCKTLKGTVTWTPPVPATSKGTKVISNTKAVVTLSGCTGTPGITSGVITLTVKGTKAQNCATRLADKSVIKASASTKWGNGTTSASPAVTLKYVSIGAYLSTGKIATGTFAGKTASTQTQYIPVAGGCLTAGKDLKSATVSLSKGKVYTVK